MTKPLVSVHMITYNHAPYIAKAIECVLAQKTNFTFELVIGEDCSTDGTREIVFDYAQRYPEIIRVIASDQNVGMKKNGNRVNAALRGKYIAFCEGDDYWHRNDKLQLQADMLEANSNCGLVCSDFDALNVTTGERIDSLVRSRGWQVPSSRNIEDYVAGHGGNIGSVIQGSIMTLTVMARRQLVINCISADPYLYQSDAFMRGDTQLWAEINSIAEIMFIPDSLATRGVLPESAGKSRNPAKQLRFLINGSDLFLYLCEKYGVSKDVRMMHEKVRLRLLLRLAYHERDVEMANAVRAQLGLVNVKEWLCYFSALYPFVHSCYTLAKRLRKITRLSDDSWI